MYALDLTAYARWQEFPPTARYFVKLWIDGLHVGTHVHWALSPVSVDALTYLWDFFADPKGKPQRAAIRYLAHLRRNPAFYAGLMPLPTASDTDWGAFFAQQKATLVARKNDVLVRAMDLLVRAQPSNSVSSADASALAHELRAALAIAGWSTDDLFNRMMNYVVDPLGRSPLPPAQRLEAFLEYFRAPTDCSYIAWVPVVAQSDWSASQRRAFSTLRLDAATSYTGTRTVTAFVDGKPIIVGRVDGPHSVPERARRNALQLLRMKMGPGIGLGPISLGATTYLVLTTDLTRPPWKYPNKVGELPLELFEGSFPTQALASSISALFDDPQGVIGAIFAEFEGGGHVPPSAAPIPSWTQIAPMANAYRWGLRTALGDALGAYVARLRALAHKAEALPPLAGVRYYRERNDTERGAVLAELERAAPDEDVLLLEHLREVVSWRPSVAPGIVPLPHDTVREIACLLVLAKGFRNKLQHAGAGPVPPELYGLMLYVAKTSLHAYASLRNRPLAPLVKKVLEHVGGAPEITFAKLHGAMAPANERDLRTVLKWLMRQERILGRRDKNVGWVYSLRTDR